MPCCLLAYAQAQQNSFEYLNEVRGRYNIIHCWLHYNSWYVP
jgi:hypothetical protein